MQHAAEAISLLGFVWITFQAVTAVGLSELWIRFYGGMGLSYDIGLYSAIVLTVPRSGRS